MVRNIKKSIIEFFKDLYNLGLNKEELEAFIEYLQTKKGKENS